MSSAGAGAGAATVTVTGATVRTPSPSTTRLPLYDDLGIKWVLAITPLGFVRSMLVWADEARAGMFDASADADEARRRTADQRETCAVVRRAVVSRTLDGATQAWWVVRSVKILVKARHEETLMDRGRFRGNASIQLSSRVTRVGTSSMEFEHDVFVFKTGADRAERRGVLAGVVSGTVVPLDAATRKPRKMTPQESSELRERVLDTERPPSCAGKVEMPDLSLLRLGDGIKLERGVARVIARQSDLDGLGHVNNTTGLAFMLDAMPPALVERLPGGGIVVEYVEEILAGEEGHTRWVLWSTPRGEWKWRGDLFVGDSLRLKAFASSDARDLMDSPALGSPSSSL